MVSRKKQYSASQPIRVGIQVTADDNPFVIDMRAEGAEGPTALRFDRWLGKGIDPWVHLLVQQLKVLKNGKSIARKTVISYARDCVMVYLDFLARSGATYAPTDLNRRRLELFIEWLPTEFPQRKARSHASTYSGVKVVLTGLMRRGLIPNDKNLFPAGRFLGCQQERAKEEPLSPRERARLAEALRDDVITLHHRPDSLRDSDALIIYALALCLRTGLNTTPMLELKRDAMTRHPFFPKMGQLTSFKRRNNSLQRMTLVCQTVKETAAVPVDAVALFNKVLERTRPLADSAPEHLRAALWLYRTAGNNRRGYLCRLTIRNLYDRVGAFVRRHQLIADDGTPLRITNQRLRVTMENRLWKLSNGDLFTVAALMGHHPKVADQHYLAVTPEMRAHAAIVGEALPDSYRDKPDEPLPRLEPTPVGSCQDSLHGEKAPKDGVSHCVDFLSCFQCRSYAIVGSMRDLHRLFSFYWFLAREKARIPSRAWREQFAYLMSLIDAFTLDKFDNKLVKRAKAEAKSNPIGFWKSYQSQYHPRDSNAN